MIFLDMDNCPFRYELSMLPTATMYTFPFIVEHFVKFGRNDLYTHYEPPYIFLYPGQKPPDYTITMKVARTEFAYDGSSPVYLDGKGVTYPAKGLVYDLRSCFD